MTLLKSKPQVKRHLVKLITIALGLNAIVICGWVYNAFKPPALFHKDFIQFYLMAKAEASGQPIYTPLVDLALEFDTNLGDYHQHPAAYPPTVLYFIVPLAKFSYIGALIVWDSIEVLCFALATILIWRELRSRTAVDWLALVTVSCVVWPPFYYDLYHGQVMMMILLLLTGTWLAIKSGRHRMGGICLGLLFALKLYAWPILLFLVWRRKYRSVFWAIGLFILLNAIIAMWLGTGIFSQYLEVAQQISLIYRTHPSNFSPFAIGTELVGTWFGVSLGVLALIIAFALAARAPDFDHAFMIMTAVSIITSPVAWGHYLITLMPAFCLITSWKSVQCQEKVLMAILVCFTLPEIYRPFLSEVIVRLIPLLFVFGVMLLLGRLLRHESRFLYKWKRSAQH